MENAFLQCDRLSTAIIGVVLFFVVKSRDIEDSCAIVQYRFCIEATFQSELRVVKRGKGVFRCVILQ